MLLSTILSIIYLFIGSYQNEKEEGIQVYAFDTETAEATYICGSTGVRSPGFICLSKDGRFVYSVGEVPDTTRSTVNCLRFDPRKKTLKLVSSQPAHGGSPSYIATSPNERMVVTANYYTGNITACSVNRKGVLGKPMVFGFEGSSVNPQRQTHPYMHGVFFTPDGKELWCTDLGTDLIRVFPVGPKGLPLIDKQHQKDYFMKPNLGPRHLVFAEGKPIAYLLGEMSGEVCTLDFSTPGEIKLVQALAEANEYKGESAADIHISPDGRFVYSSYREKGDGLAIMKVQEDGTLVKVGYQRTARYPRNFAISPDGRFVLLASRDDNVVEIYARDLETGLLSDTGKRIKYRSPTCLKFFVPKGVK